VKGFTQVSSFSIQVSRLPDFHSVEGCVESEAGFFLLILPLQEHDAIQEGDRVGFLGNLTQDEGEIHGLQVMLL